MRLTSIPKGCKYNMCHDQERLGALCRQKNSYSVKLYTKVPNNDWSLSWSIELKRRYDKTSI